MSVSPDLLWRFSMMAALLPAETGPCAPSNSTACACGVCVSRAASGRLAHPAAASSQHAATAMRAERSKRIVDSVMRPASGVSAVSWLVRKVLVEETQQGGDDG